MNEASGGELKSPEGAPGQPEISNLEIQAGAGNHEPGTSSTACLRAISCGFRAFCRRLRGNKQPCIPAPPLSWTAFSVLQATVSIYALACMINSFEGSTMAFMLTSFGSSAVLMHSAKNAPLAQPRAVLFGTAVSSFVGVSVDKVFGSFAPNLARALSVSLSILAMERLRCTHPPAASMALTAVRGSAKVRSLGYWFILFPSLTGVALMLALALVLNNLDEKRKYPESWEFPEIKVVVGWVRRRCCSGDGGGDAEQRQHKGHDDEEGGGS